MKPCSPRRRRPAGGQLPAPAAAPRRAAGGAAERRAAAPAGQRPARAARVRGRHRRRRGRHPDGLCAAAAHAAGARPAPRSAPRSQAAGAHSGEPSWPLPRCAPACERSRPARQHRWTGCAGALAPRGARRGRLGLCACMRVHARLQRPAAACVVHRPVSRSACPGSGAHAARPEQASVELPAADAEAGALRECYAPALGWADAFWQGLFDRCARACARSAADQCWPSCHRFSCPPGQSARVLCKEYMCSPCTCGSQLRVLR
jgi:hypothetical protein